MALEPDRFIQGIQSAVKAMADMRVRQAEILNAYRSEPERSRNCESQNQADADLVKLTLEMDRLIADLQKLLDSPRG